MSKPLWVTVFILTGALLLWRGTIAGWKLYDYSRLSSEVSAEISSIEVVPKGTEYAHRVTYRYTYNNRAYTNTMTLSKPYYLNRASAETEKDKMLQMSWIAWIDARHPHFSSLECSFPLKESFYALCLLGVFLYFTYLRIHLELLSRSM